MKKENDPRQTYLQICAPTNLQCESLWQEIITSIKQYGKVEIKNITKNIYAAFSCLWNLKSTITCKCGGVALFLTSVYFVIRKLILLFSYSFHVPCIILSSVYFYMCVLCFPFFLIDHNQKQVLLIKRVILFLKLKNIFLLFSTFWKGHIYNIVLTLINVIKLDAENSSIVSTLSNIVNINVEIDSVDLTLSNVATSYHRNRNVETTLKGFLGIYGRLKVNFIKLNTYIFSKIPLNSCFRKLSERYS